MGPDLDKLAASVGATKARGTAPVDAWHPPYGGEIDLRIAADGAWSYAGTPILRPALVTLFAGLLRKDHARYVLVTPAECLGIVVEDAPFIGVTMEERDGALVIGTNLGDEVRASADHPFRFVLDEPGGVKPYVHVRGGLEAKLTRALALDLLGRAEARVVAGIETLGVVSDGMFFPVVGEERVRDL